MAKTNITLKIDADLLKKIKVLAAQQDTSISALLAASLEEKLKTHLNYQKSKRKALARLEKGYDLGFQRVRSRGELHER